MNIYAIISKYRNYLTQSLKEYNRFKEDYEECFELSQEQIDTLDLDLYNLDEYSIEIIDNSPVFSVSFENQKITKLRNLEKEYNLSQVVRFVNGVIFDFNLRRPAIDEIRMAASKAAQDGTAFIQVTGIDGKIYKTDCIYSVLKKVQDAIDKPISQYNWSEYDVIRNKINKASSLEELNLVREPNFLVNGIVNINQICEEIFNEETTSNTDITWLSTRRTLVDNEAHYTIFEEAN